MILLFMSLLGTRVFGAEVSEFSDLGSSVNRLFTGFITGELPDFSDHLVL